MPPKPNYGYEKRQRELAKKNKKADKAERKTGGGGAPGPDDGAPEQGADMPADGAAQDTPPPAGN